ncbi:hypothetical protein VOI54_01040 [Tamlana sp. 2201CG12-4]|uniref:hypothetical protein n=1 Tax=Tamlana sp. 2201CG12-4 TaxID=3112582 RepID=UPI002DBF2A36|nr:hypothetical protein [Tamlana sp. 2201CG12-4]MEC3905592.1 hypothetical protein [Tamlana sp. 2201CG12-4]
MQIITKYLVLVALCFAVQLINAQDSIRVVSKTQKIEELKTLKENIEKEERTLLKAQVEAINSRWNKGEITEERANTLKKEAAKKHALNIENRIAIIDNKIALLERNDGRYVTNDKIEQPKTDRDDEEEDDSFFGIVIKEKKKTKKYDRRTRSDIVFAFGFNNAIIEGQSLDDSPYKIGGSGFMELGFAWKTRLLDNSNFFRLKYGVSFQWNKLNIKDNKYLVNNEGTIDLETFPLGVNKVKFRTTNLVFPVHLEFGPSKKREYDDYFRYSTHRQIKFGVGVYGGFNLGTLQKLKYIKEDGGKAKDKFKSGYNTSDLIYGLSGYVALGGTAIYVKYDLNPIFKNQEIEQNNISLGVRFDMD